MRPAGADLYRRWLTALMMAPENEREAIVEAVEAQFEREYGDRASNTCTQLGPASVDDTTEAGALREHVLRLVGVDEEIAPGETRRAGA